MLQYGEGGDCYSFIMKLENLEFYEAVEFLSQKYAIPIQYEKGQHSAKELSIRKQILEIHSIASEWFHKQFIQSEEAEGCARIGMSNENSHWTLPVNTKSAMRLFAPMHSLKSSIKNNFLLMR